MTREYWKTFSIRFETYRCRTAWLTNRWPRMGERWMPKEEIQERSKTPILFDTS